MPHTGNLRASELRVLLTAIEVLHAHDSTPDLSPRIAEALEQAISCELICIDNFATTDFVYTHKWANSAWEQIGLKYMQAFMEYIHQHPFLESVRHDGL